MVSPGVGISYASVPLIIAPAVDFENNNETNYACPTRAHVLGTFAVVNVISSIVSVLLSHSGTVKIVTFGKFGNSESEAWKYLWILPFGLQLAANAIIGALIWRTPNYIVNAGIFYIMLFYTVRPRFTFVLLGLLSYHDSKQYDQSAFSHPWLSASLANLIAEFPLFVIASYFMGVTVKFAAEMGVYDGSGTGLNLMSEGARLMYAGALYFIIGGSLSWLFALWTILSLTKKYPRTTQSYTQNQIYGRQFTQGNMNHSRFSSLNRELANCVWILSSAVALSVYAASWLFWVGFVDLLKYE